MMALIFGCLNLKRAFSNFIFGNDRLTHFDFRMGHKMTVVRFNFYATMG